MGEQTLQEWLEQVCRCHEVEPVRVTIDSRVFEGCRYKQARRNDPSTAAYRRGEREHTIEAMYLLGEPEMLWRNGRVDKVCFTIEGDEREWYVGSWARVDVVTDPRYAQFHYGVGPHFLLFPWSAPGKIDDGSERLYRRISAEVEEVVAA